ncbi:site-specific recombinase XerD [Paraburkholderia sp. GV068]|uniref:site-specific integrase n=1 Tax=unclassified Paraburkholderia TaxID=2615204 RepID=UPI000D31C724|nr:MULTISPECIES: site-specific integrase [unclassified Paraburkholderia]PTR04331.1 site-specific recombinase XerD [Paraburkholderia sp. GV072]PUB09288.1 site-specific recombinase XerD [Paraburkholderia sp. GV068]
MATITKRTDQAPHRRWQARVRRKGFPTLSKSFATKTEAELWAREAEQTYDKGHAVDLKDARETTLKEVLQRYLDEVVPNHKGAKPETYRIRQLIAMPIAQFALANITRRAAADFRDERIKHVSGSTVTSEMNVIGRAIETARTEWGVHLVYNPFHRVRRPKANASRDRRLEDGEEARLLAACRASRCPYLAPAVIVAIETGMRQSEIRALKWAHIDTARRYAVLPTTKNGDARVVPLSSRALAAIEEMKTARQYKYQGVSLERVDGPFAHIDATVIRHAFMRARDKAGMPDLRFHDLRHEATSRLFEKGFNTMEVSSITGHKTMQMLKRYTHLRAEELALRLG